MDHVACGADAVVVAGTASQANVLRHGDLDVVDVVRVPHRLKDLVSKAQRQDVLDGLFAQVVVDAEDRGLRKDGVDNLIELAGRLLIVAERLFNDHAPP